MTASADSTRGTLPTIAVVARPTGTKPIAENRRSRYDYELLERFDPQKPVRLVGVGVAGLVSAEERHQPGQLTV